MTLKKMIGGASLLSFAFVASTFAVSAADTGGVVTTNATTTGFMRGMHNKKGMTHRTLTDAEKLTMQTNMAERLSLVLGRSKESILADLQANKKIEDIVSASGMTQADFESKMKTLHTTEMKAKLDAEVATGKITQAEADKRLANMANHAGGRGHGKTAGWAKHHSFKAGSQTGGTSQ